MRISDWSSDVCSSDLDYSPDRVLTDGDVVAGPDWTIEAVATPGHTSNHLCFAYREGEALFTGDHVMGWSTTVVSPPDGEMADYMRSLEKLLEIGRVSCRESVGQYV